jgi:hypothetical protein
VPVFIATFFARQVVVLISVALATQFCITPSVQATTVIPVDLAHCAKRAGAIFAGTVSGMESVRLDETIVTHVDFTDVTYVKGGPRNARTRITYEGGVVGNDRVFSMGQPEFELGSRYILLVVSDFGTAKPWYIPIVGLYQGFFKVAPDSSQKVIHDWANRPVVRVEGRHLVVVSRRNEGQSHAGGLVRILPSEEDTGKRMTEAEFLREVRKLATQ